MSEDVKTLREASLQRAAFTTHMAGYRILCRVVADMIEREEGANCRKELHERFKDRPDLNAQMDAPAPPSIDDFTTDLSAEDRGWNAALDAAEKAVCVYGGKFYGAQTLNEICSSIAKLRRTERGEG
jgi:hypothetical protein